MIFMGNSWHTKTPSEIFETLHSGKQGLSKEEASRQREKYGLNKLPEAKRDGLIVIFLRQFQSPLIYILFAASLIVLAMGEVADGLIIAAILLFNAVVGTIQEGRAQSTLAALKNFAETNAAVLRDGREIIVGDVEIVVGDIILLREGDKTPADARVIFSNNLKVDEALLTGESKPAHKITEVLKNPNLPPAEQSNVVFKGSHIVAGSGEAIVFAVGLETEIGRISKEVAAIDTEIPLKADIRRLSRLIIVVVVGISAALFFLGLWSGNSIRNMFATVVSLAVSIIPEGLPIVMTLVLATGVWRMSKQNALVKKLQAVEALGQARVIAVDKTGTITKNELVVQRVYVGGKFFEVGGVGYEPKGDIKFEDNVVEPLNHPELLFAAKTAALSADARVMFNEETEEWRVAGDPTEAALLVFAEKVGFHKEDLEQESPKIAELPFDYLTKYHATIHKTDAHYLLSVAGAPEVILGLCQKIWRDEKSFPLSGDELNRLESIFAQISRAGFRVLAFATRHFPEKFVIEENIQELTFGGFFAMRDALRPEVHQAMERAKAAGVRVVMITGDHKLTAQTIAKEAGIWREGDEILQGRDIDTLSDNELSSNLARVSVFARVTPEHKLRIIQAYRKRGEVVAMTGDGVNDAPPLVAADLGVAMGKIGTEVAKEAADIVLLDDNFGNIVSAIEEGRSIYKTIKKVVLYLFSTSWGEALTIIGALLLGYPLPILPSQIIWLNFVTDGFLDVALAMEPKEEDLLRGNFERPKKYLVDKLMVWRMALMAIPMMVGAIYLFGNYFRTDLAKAWTMSLTALAVFQWFNAWNCRSDKKSIFKMKFFANKFLVGATIIVVILQFLALYNPSMQKLLHTTSLGLADWFLIIPIAASIILVEETRKYFYRRKKIIVSN